MKKKALNLPINIVSCYLTITYVLYFWGPWDYGKNTKLMFFFLCCLVLLYLGYKLGILLTTKYDIKREYPLDNTDKILKFLGKSTVIALIMVIPDFIYTTHLVDFSFLEILIMIGKAFFDPYQNYSQSLDYVVSGSIGESLFVAINVLLYFFRFLVLPLSIRYWRKISRFQKFSAITLTIVECLKWLLKGMNKGIFDIVFIIFSSLLISVLSKQDLTTNRIVKKNIRKTFRIVILLVIGALIMFGINSISRSQDSKISYYSTYTNLSADPNNLILNIFPQFMQRVALSFFSYLTQGYYAVFLGISLPFKFCFGIGHNMFFITNFRQYFGIDVWNNTYMVRISEIYTWGSRTNWHSLYSWIANDVSYLGVPIVMFFLGAFFSYIWKDAIINQNPFAGLIFTLLTIEFFYIPANNQIGAYPYMTVAFYITIIFWGITRNRYSQRTN